MYFYIQSHTLVLKIIVIIVTIWIKKKRKADEKCENTPLQCSFGEFMDSTCYCNLKPEAITSLFKFGEDKQTIFKMRAGIMLFDESVVNICRYHQLHLGEYFENKQTKCFDIFQKYKKKKAMCSHNINLKMAEMLRSKVNSGSSMEVLSLLHWSCK